LARWFRDKAEPIARAAHRGWPKYLRSPDCGQPQCWAAAPQPTVASGQQTRDQIARAEAQLAQTLAELRGLAKGLHPGVLSERGLEGALAALARDFPIPVQVTVAGDRVPSSVAVVAYFVCAEALANVAKHASASGVAVSVTARDDRVRVEIEDDGVGAADPGRGSGLRGLADRVETIGGRCGWKALLGMGRASPPRSRSAARRRGDR
jgi:signal transduction histidine kinase